MLRAAHAFFAVNTVLEVETPALSFAATSDPNIENVRCRLRPREPEPLYLHTSPEAFMKRLLAAGSPDIYQICKVFRDGESGSRHQPEFTLIEWYRKAYDLNAMIQETCDLIMALGSAVNVASPRCHHHRYRDVFKQATQIDPLDSSIEQLANCANRLFPNAIDRKLTEQLGDDRNAWLDLLMSHIVIPGLEQDTIASISHYPATQAALARLDPDDDSVAERFEVFYRGHELANGYRELLDAGEQRRRFETEQQIRRDKRLPAVPADEDLIAALAHGMPDCAGVAVGFDRLIMAFLGFPDIRQVQSFALHFTRETYS
ncbi:Elongation factor P--(R)-beta-lysine ligase [subsurface metagenome]